LNIAVGDGAGIFEDLRATRDFAQTYAQLRRYFPLRNLRFQHLHQLPSQGQIGDFRPGEDFPEEFTHGFFIRDPDENPDQIARVRVPDPGFVSMHRNNLTKKKTKVKVFFQIRAFAP
jgi:hypothetical protein